jgi:hypothetical protein
MENPNTRIDPGKITKPFQLLGGAIAFSAICVCAFLGAAIQMSGNWMAGLLVVSAIVYPPVLLGFLGFFIIRFRKEILADGEYIKFQAKNMPTPERLRLEERPHSITKIVSIPREIELPLPTLTSYPRKVALNINFPRWADLKLRLENEGMPNCTPFGGEDGSKPDRWIVAINENMELNQILKMINIGIDFNFDGFSLWTPNQAYGENEDVYFGAFGVAKFAPFSDEFKELIVSNASEFSLKKYVLTHTS